MKLDFKSFVAGVLSLSAVLLVFMHLNLTSVAQASEAITGRDFQLVTARIAKGGDALYILNKRTGLIGIFTWDPSAKGVTVKDVRSMDDMMGANAVGPQRPTR